MGPTDHELELRPLGTLEYAGCCTFRVVELNGERHFELVRSRHCKRCQAFILRLGRDANTSVLLRP